MKRMIDARLVGCVGETIKEASLMILCFSLRASLAFLFVFARTWSYTLAGENSSLMNACSCQCQIVAHFASCLVGGIIVWNGLEGLHEFLSSFEFRSSSVELFKTRARRECPG